MCWSEQMLAYFTAGRRHFVVRAWWGARLVIALDQLRPIEPQELSDELHRTECELVLRGLRHLVAETENGEQPEYDSPSTNQSRCTVGTLVHFPGLLGLIEAVPLLRVLEERLVGSGSCWGYFRYAPHEERQLAQASLRRLGQAPRCYPALTFLEDERRDPLRRPQPGPMDGPSRHANLSRIGRGAPLAQVYQLLGAPDELGTVSRDNSGRAGSWRDCWRYDVDRAPPYTVVLWLGEDDAVTRIVKYFPPFWSFFPSRTYSLLGSESPFAGSRIEVDVLQELAASGRAPWAPLARAVLDGAHDALGPLADALEEAGDPRAARVCATHARSG
jgi:hypothetical protein